MYWADHILEDFMGRDCLAAMVPYMANAESRRQLHRLPPAPPGKPHDRPAGPACRSKGAPGPAAAPLQASAPSRMDPISSTLIVFMSRPIELILNEVGAMPFQDRPTLVFPYRLMTPGQKAFLRQCIARTDEWSVCNDTTVFHRPPAPIFTPPANALTVMCEGILRGKSQHDHKTRIGLCNIILQRVRSRIPVNANTHREVNEWVAANA